MRSSYTVRLSQRDFAKAVDVTTHAFRTYAFLQYLTPQTDARMRFARWFCTSCIRYGQLYGRVDTNSTVNGVAVWLTPGRTTLTPWRLLRSGFISAPIHVHVQSLKRFILSNSHMEHEHKRFADKHHWYLMALGVDPQYQGQGVGSQIIQPVLELADAQHEQCYLETQTERNSQFYERHGFKIMSQKTMPDSEMTIFAMVRKPKL